MKIRVVYSELRSSGNFSNQRAEASIEVEVPTEDLSSEDVAAAFEKAWSVANDQVKKQFPPVYIQRILDEDDGSGSGPEDDDDPDCPF